MSGIALNGVFKSFGDEQVVSDFSMNVPNGKRVCLMGKSGSGKTTILNILLGFCEPDAGTVSIGRSSLAVVFQEDRLCDDFSALSNVRMVCGSESKAIECLNNMGLSDHLDKPVNELSGGMKRRVAIARALSMEADTIIFDEPFKGLDDATKLSVLDYVKEMTAGKTFLFITHDATEAELLGAETIFLQ